ncbi:V-type ATP synthase subunit E [Halococcoides cellulosivorans]|uniref:A-type ATP synthase subunit E n=1 Tax=Halococcoides cellulosivorans TaxID=1679096 RepID=A0A2R4X377_9EURY|nr:V-type ATP synthase subunit E [Halococcoides cellulosivorans]AWB28255.1 V-type ATP synthase subunit E [Halococcoides cellulosivorans]
MSLETVVEDIREQAEAQAEAIREEAEAEAEEIRAEAEAEADQIREQRERDVERQIDQERERGLSNAELEAKQARLRARRSVLQDVRERVEDELVELDGDRRRDLTESLLTDALDEFDEGSLVVHGRAEDRDLLDDLVTDRDATVGDPRDCLGGVVVTSEGARVRVNNTFDAVLEDVWEEHLRAVSDRLFEEE